MSSNYARILRSCTALGTVDESIVSEDCRGSIEAEHVADLAPTPPFLPVCHPKPPVVARHDLLSANWSAMVQLPQNGTDPMILRGLLE